MPRWQPPAVPDPEARGMAIMCRRHERWVTTIVQCHEHALNTPFITKCMKHTVIGAIPTRSFGVGCFEGDGKANNCHRPFLRNFIINLWGTLLVSKCIWDFEKGGLETRWWFPNLSHYVSITNHLPLIAINELFLTVSLAGPAIAIGKVHNCNFQTSSQLWYFVLQETVKHFLCSAVPHSCKWQISVFPTS